MRSAVANARPEFEFEDGENVTYAGPDSIAEYSQWRAHQNRRTGTEFDLAQCGNDVLKTSDDAEFSHILIKKANLVTSEASSRALAKASEDPALYMHDTRRLAGRLLC
ncbi:hypothetical protein GOC91_14755 [Sinorhizobium medicae]|uniref:Uncharacterized protein n=1 Tax=Sinorhizobium medicae (strain WSM419) TaxID=366394 RepID=A6UL69_SINMW|nr:hypothetical protein Smed_5669 [Sinorhizobium medicae WSM419]MDX0424994.1 hypothetical protein [Sinorhizobium medicae]MDX0437812.1 hypothetical protein [Sinorhizobium medicae]MDX0456087.1 hypothetical protein [Sinorhizobium medicae]MDX0481367.1 hypothetical protein [Sinorhizobium medicae]